MFALGYTHWRCINLGFGVRMHQKMQLSHVKTSSFLDRKALHRYSSLVFKHDSETWHLCQNEIYQGVDVAVPSAYENNVLLLVGTVMPY